MRNGKLIRAAFENPPTKITEEKIDELVERARAWLRMQRINHVSTAFGWSGGKDAAAVRYIIEPFRMRHVTTGAADFEFVEWRQHVNVVDTKIYNHPSLVNPKRMSRKMLFPTASVEMYSWFKMTNQYAWHVCGAKQVVVGKRTQDGNRCGKNGVFIDREGLRQLCPIVHWKHQHVAALIHYKNLQYLMCPMYQWPDGFETTDKRWITRPVRAESKLEPLDYIGSLSPETRERAERVIKRIEWT
jgi:3'-phosphoadenosine 5'-phosphosulfate sulfotransferase (PAPS reductase)/FAD synthetase